MNVCVESGKKEFKLFIKIVDVNKFYIINDLTKKLPNLHTKQKIEIT